MDQTRDESAHVPAPGSRAAASGYPANAARQARRSAERVELPRPLAAPTAPLDFVDE